jgi:hypothetical protein
MAVCEALAGAVAVGVVIDRALNASLPQRIPIQPRICKPVVRLSVAAVPFVNAARTLPGAARNDTGRN